MIKFEGTLIRKEHIGYVVVKEIEYPRTEWVLDIFFMNNNKHETCLRFNYASKEEAESKLNELEKLLAD